MDKHNPHLTSARTLIILLNEKLYEAKEFMSRGSLNHAFTSLQQAEATIQRAQEKIKDAEKFHGEQIEPGFGETLR